MRGRHAQTCCREKQLLGSCSAKFGVLGKLQCPLQMLFNLRQGVAREFLEVPIRPILDLVLEERSVALLILDLATK